MNNTNCAFERITGNELERVIEPLASYICATERPQTALKSALTLLFREVEATNRSARSHFRSCLQN
jgi:hypothetical protein